jgi:hypothetical protein
MEVLMATKKVVKKVKKAVKPVLKKKAKPVIKKKAKPVAKKIERYACRVCGLAVTVDQNCSCEYLHEFVCCDKVMKKK